MGINLNSRGYLSGCFDRGLSIFFKYRIRNSDYITANGGVQFTSSVLTVKFWRSHGTYTRW